MITIPRKDIQEIIQLGFNFTDELGAAAISSAELTNEVLYGGVDATPATMLAGFAPQLSGAYVYHLYKGGVSGVTYKVKCLATLNDGRKLMRIILVQATTL